MVMEVTELTMVIKKSMEVTEVKRGDERYSLQGEPRRKLIAL
jgi:hypothetical protein